MRIDLDRYAPLGIDAEQETKWLLRSLAAGCGWSVIVFIGSYLQAWDDLYVRYGMTQKGLREGAVIAPFTQILMGTETLFLLVCAVMPLWAVYHYRYHYIGSKPIYLMRRLPESWELHRRCLALPACGALATLVLQGLLGILYYLIYIFCTPRQCLPV